MEKTVLAVGDSTRLEIIYSSKRAKTRIRKSPRIKTNEGKRAKRVQISAMVTPRPDSTYPIVISPYKVDMSQFTKKKVDKKTFEITNVSDEDVKIKLVAYANEYFEVKLPKSVEAGETEEGEVKIPEEYLEKSFAKSFTIELDDEKTSRYTVPVKRTVRNLKPKGVSKTSGK